MRLLLVVATEPEIAPLLAAMTLKHEADSRLKSYEYNGHAVDVLITGVGMVAAAVWTARTLATVSYDAAINAGICGSFDRGIELGEVVCVHTDFTPELGAEDDDQFLDIHELQLLDKDGFPYRNGVLHGSSSGVFAVFGQLKSVSGITVNKVHGNEQTIAAITQRHNPQTESMEGAAFYYACAVAGVPAMQLRAVSNYVERRNRAAWKIGEAVENLNAAVLNYLDQR